MSFDYQDNLSGEARHRYAVKLDAVGLQECPYKHPADRWIDDPKSWPSIEYADIFCYLVYSHGPFTHSVMKNYRSLEAHHQFRAGWVQTVYHQVTAKDFFIFKTAVKPSQRMNDPAHNPWVATQKSGEVVAAHCTCMAGLGESCTHVAAMLFKIEAAVRLGYTSTACTDVACQWNNMYVSNVKAAEIRNINFYRDEAKDGIKKGTKMQMLEMANKDDENEFIASLMEGENVKPVGLSLFEGPPCQLFLPKKVPEEPQFRLPQPLRSYYSKPDDIDQNRKKLLQLQVLPEELYIIEQATQSQSDSATWYDQRAGRITASRVHSVLHTNQERPGKLVLLGITMARNNSLTVPALVYGRENEEKILNTFKCAGAALHKDFHVEPTGLTLHPKYHWLGATADGLVDCKCHGKGVVEIKCPYNARTMSIEQYLGTKNCPVLYDGEYSMNKVHSYYHQVQTQMLVYDVNYCTFLVKVGEEMIGFDVPRDEEFGQNMYVLKTFWEMHVVPEILTRELELGVEPMPDRRTYCYCKEPFDENDDSLENTMVGCDGANCPYEWVHLRCMKRKTVPKGKWYCKACKK